MPPKNNMAHFKLYKWKVLAYLRKSTVIWKILWKNKIQTKCKCTQIFLSTHLTCKTHFTFGTHTHTAIQSKQRKSTQSRKAHSYKNFVCHMHLRCSFSREINKKNSNKENNEKAPGVGRNTPQRICRLSVNIRLHRLLQPQQYKHKQRCRKCLKRLGRK